MEGYKFYTYYFQDTFENNLPVNVQLVQTPLSPFGVGLNTPQLYTWSGYFNVPTTQSVVFQIATTGLSFSLYVEQTNRNLASIGSCRNQAVEYVPPNSGQYVFNYMMRAAYPVLNQLSPSRNVTLASGLYYLELNVYAGPLGPRINALNISLSDGSPVTVFMSVGSTFPRVFSPFR